MKRWHCRVDDESEEDQNRPRGRVGECVNCEWNNFSQGAVNDQRAVNKPARFMHIEDDSAE